jgi:hypothetical protein
MLKLQHLVHKVPCNYSSCTCRSSENICSSNSGGTQGKKRKDGVKTGWNSVWPNKVFCISEFDPSPLKAILFVISCNFMRVISFTFCQLKQIAGMETNWQIASFSRTNCVSHFGCYATIVVVSGWLPGAHKKCRIIYLF